MIHPLKFLKKDITKFYTETATKPYSKCPRYWQIFGVRKSTLGYVQLLQKVLNHDFKNLYVLSGGDDLLTITCILQRIFFIPLQKRRGNTRRSAWCRAPIPISWM